MPRYPTSLDVNNRCTSSVGAPPKKWDRNEELENLSKLMAQYARASREKYEKEV